MKNKLRQLLYSLLFLVVGLIVFFTNITLAPTIDPTLLYIAQLILIAISALLYFKFKAGNKIQFQNITYAFLCTTIAYTVVKFLTFNNFGLSINTAQGLALIKFFESFIIVGTIILLFKLAKYNLNSIYISKGKLVLGLIVGLCTFFGMLILGPPNPVNIDLNEFYIKYLPWLLIFIFSNAIMEEILFRGIFIKNMIPLTGPTLAIIVTSMVFALSHMQISYQNSSEIIGFVGITFILAVLWAFIMYKTKSVIASILFHAGADMVIMASIYKSVGIIT